MSKVAPGHAHNISKLNVIFAVSSVFLLFSTLWMIWFDYSREWKGFQRQFVQMERDLTARQIQEAQQGINQADLQRVQGELQQAQTALAAEQAALEAIEAEIADLDTRRTLADIREREIKAVYDSDKFYYEETRERGTPLGRAVSDEEFAALETSFFTARDVRVALDFELTQKRAELREQRSSVTELAGAMEELTQAVTLARNKLDSLAPSFPNTFRNLPVVDFIDPSIEVRQVLVRNVTEELNFAQVPRIDRCQTCHLAIDNPDYADAPQPFTTHPNLDIFVSRESSHPVDDFGCTSCHLGRGRKLSFSGATHMPESVEEEHAWMEQYGWKEDHYWDNPMYQANLTEAGCIKCHRDQVFIPGAQHLNQSRMTYELSGCWGCHNTAGYEDKRNRGPSLKRIAHKTDRDFVARWVRDPKAFRESTWMPTFWNLDNNPDSDLQARNDTEVAAIVEYVFEHSTDDADYAAPPRGSAERGEALVNEIGCLGCHLTDETGYDQASIYRRRGPALVGTGTKLDAGFVYEWVRNPRHYWEETYMPDLRLTDQEAADITAWLMGLESNGFASMGVPQADAGELDELTREFLRTSLPDAMAAERLAGMSERDKLLFSGEWLIRRHGCFGCHEIGGFEDAQKIGVDLSTWGSKMVTRLDFGYIDIPHTRQAWLEQKLASPRSYDRGKVKAPAEKLRMPQFGFTDSDRQHIVRNVLGLVRDEFPQEGTKTLSAAEAVAEQARHLIHNYNCRGCHLIDGVGGGIYETIEDTGMRPPDLHTQGRRTQADWLYHFLEDPTEVRFWLTARMPSFNFTNEEANTLISGFLAMDGGQPFDDEQAREYDRAELRVGAQLLDQLQCERCHIAAAAGTMEASQLAPSFRLAGERLTHDWIVDWMLDPQSITPGTQMPQFWPTDQQGNRLTPLPDILDGDPMAQMRAVASYLMNYDR
ncbi:MAG: cytochrome c [Acidobacteria bacterium]|nr:cytochrome c [Acidobacteriota bacterium]MYA47359.1 cytochrome c [Acidobacteriota bacterium]MYI39144.1 cytochrome c [Acidobacteriota bacterium]